MTSSDNPVQRKSRQDKLAAIIRDRLELDEEWFPVTERPKFLGEIEKSRLSEFENAFGRMLKVGCKWEVLLTCLARCHTYNTRERIVRSGKFDSEGELILKPEMGREGIGRPPDRDERNSIGANLDPATRIVQRHAALLFELSQLDLPPRIIGPRLSADEAIVYLPELLRWCRKLLTSDDGLGNFSTVESVGQLVPCVYVDVVTPRSDSARNRRLPLTPVADLLRTILGERRYKQDQLREALSRFQRQYPSVYRQLRAKIEDLHRASNESPDGWRQLFAAEARRRSR